MWLSNRTQSNVEVRRDFYAPDLLFSMFSNHISRAGFIVPCLIYKKKKDCLPFSPFMGIVGRAWYGMWKCLGMVWPSHVMGLCKLNLCMTVQSPSSHASVMHSKGSINLLSNIWSKLQPQRHSCHSLSESTFVSGSPNGTVLWCNDIVLIAQALEDPTRSITC